MKKLLALSCLCAALAGACSNDIAQVKSQPTNSDGATISPAAGVQRLAAVTDEAQQKIEALKPLTPLGLDQLKALLPDEVCGIHRTDYNASSSMGYAVAEATYQKDEKTDLKIRVYDCAGEAGSAFYTMAYWSALNVQQESDREYTKTIDLNGEKAIENYKKDANETTFTYVRNNRLLVVLNGNNMNPGDVKGAAQKIVFKL